MLGLGAFTQPLGVSVEYVPLQSVLLPLKLTVPVLFIFAMIACCSSWVKPTQLSVCDVFSKEAEDLKKKNKTKQWRQGLEEAQEWLESDQVFPMFAQAKGGAADKKRKPKEVEAEAPPAKKPKKATSVAAVEDDFLSSSEEDAPYKATVADEKKARKVRVMRKLGLCPPEGSLFVTHTEKSSS